ncbi:hypothetical protein MRX96_027985 [Rhipicephalus microplus]
MPGKQTSYHCPRANQGVPVRHSTVAPEQRATDHDPEGDQPPGQGPYLGLLQFASQHKGLRRDRRATKAKKTSQPQSTDLTTTTVEPTESMGTSTATSPPASNTSTVTEATTEPVFPAQPPVTPFPVVRVFGTATNESQPLPADGVCDYTFYDGLYDTGPFDTLYSPHFSAPVEHVLSHASLHSVTEYGLSFAYRNASQVARNLEIPETRHITALQSWQGTPLAVCLTMLDDAETWITSEVRHQHDLAGLRGATCAWHAIRHVPSPARTKPLLPGATSTFRSGNPLRCHQANRIDIVKPPRKLQIQPALHRAPQWAVERSGRHHGLIQPPFFFS